MKRRAALAAAVLAALTLAACGPSPQDADESAAAFCKAHGGVDHIEYWDEEWPWSSSFDAECKDGSKID